MVESVSKYLMATSVNIDKDTIVHENVFTYSVT